jgi:hypothetical protein
MQEDFVALICEEFGAGLANAVAAACDELNVMGKMVSHCLRQARM